jgi:hypothetical protein
MGRIGKSQKNQEFAQDPYGGVGSIVKKTTYFRETRAITTAEGL